VQPVVLHDSYEPGFLWIVSNLFIIEIISLFVSCQTFIAYTNMKLGEWTPDSDIHGSFCWPVLPIELQDLYMLSTLYIFSWGDLFNVQTIFYT